VAGELDLAAGADRHDPAGLDEQQAVVDDRRALVVERQDARGAQREAGGAPGPQCLELERRALLRRGGGRQQGGEREQGGGAGAVHRRAQNRGRRGSRRYATLPLTIVICTWLRGSIGSPLQIPRSASLPTSSEPMRSSAPMKRAWLIVSARMPISSGSPSRTAIAHCSVSSCCATTGESVLMPIPSRPRPRWTSV